MTNRKQIIYGLLFGSKVLSDLNGQKYFVGVQRLAHATCIDVRVDNNKSNKDTMLPSEARLQ